MPVLAKAPPPGATGGPARLGWCGRAPSSSEEDDVALSNKRDSSVLVSGAAADEETGR